MHDLPLTGERTVPGIPHENYWFQRHVAAYTFAARRCRGLRVLDAGCGEGYGAALLAQEAASVVGVDIAPEAVAHADMTYRGVRFSTADLADLPLPPDGLDAVVCLQVLEHLPDPARVLDELARVLVRGGLLICATPNRLTFTPGGDGPVNPFHVREYAPGELVAVLSRAFAVEALYGVHHSPRLRAAELALRAPLPARLLTTPPQQWPRRLIRLVTAVRPHDFRVRIAGVERSLDLLAVARRRTMAA